MRDGVHTFCRGFFLGAAAGILYQLVKNPGGCSCCGCLLAILIVLLIVVVVVLVMTWWTWIAFVIVLAALGKLLANYLDARSKHDASDADR